MTQITVQRIILADDDEDDRSIFLDVVKEINPDIKINTVFNGLRLMEMLQHFTPDAVFLDIEMPYKNGLECLAEIKSNPALKKLFIVVLSSNNRPANIQTAYEMGAHLFLLKHGSFNQYRASIASIFQLHWKEPEAIKKNQCTNNNYVVFE